MKDREERRQALCDALTTRALTYDELMKVGMWGYHLCIAHDEYGTSEVYNTQSKIMEFNGKLMLQQLLQATRPELKQ